MGILDEIQHGAANDARVLMTLGITCASLGLFERAETAFGGVLATHPESFEVLFHLGRAAARAKHYDRAERVLEVARKMRPADPDTLIELGLLYGARQDYSRAVYVLSQARQSAPKRPDILLALARAADDAGYYGDSILAYDEYLSVQPADETARRDRARVCAATGTRLPEGLRELAAYIRRHPEDPIGHYDLAQFLWSSEPEKALEELSAALHLNPRFAPAFFARGWLRQRLGRMAESLADFRSAVRLEPENVRALDQLGLAYLGLDQPGEAEKVLRRAAGNCTERP